MCVCVCVCVYTWGKVFFFGVSPCDRLGCCLGGFASSVVWNSKGISGEAGGWQLAGWIYPGGFEYGIP